MIRLRRLNAKVIDRVSVTIRKQARHIIARHLIHPRPTGQEIPQQASVSPYATQSLTQPID